MEELLGKLGHIAATVYSAEEAEDLMRYGEQTVFFDYYGTENALVKWLKFLSYGENLKSRFKDIFNKNLDR